MVGDNRSLFQELKNDDRDSFDEIFKGYYIPLVKFAIGFLNSKEDAEDVVSTFFVNLWKKRKTLPDISYPETYLYNSIKNACLNYKRDHKKTSDIYDLEIANSTEVKNLVMESKDLETIIARTVEALPEQRRIIFSLVKESGLKNRQVSEIMGISIRTVESQLYKAVKTLAESISKHLGYDPRKSS